MVEQPYYQAEMASGVDIVHTPLKDAINDYGVRKKERANAKYGSSTTDSYTDIEIDTWARGPLLRMEAFDSDGVTCFPTIGGSFCQVIVQAGYVPWGFRPEKNHTISDGGEHTGRWLWYLRPIEDITDDDSAVYDTEFAIKTSEGEFEYLRNDQGNLVTFDNRSDAEAVADQAANDEVVEVSA